MKITIATCCHERPIITRLFLMRYEGLKKYAAEKYGIRMDLVACVSIGDHATQELFNGREWCLGDNALIGLKWNNAVSLALDTHPDYICICGDDDLLLNSWLDSVVESIGMVGPYFDSEPWSGVTSAYVINQYGQAVVLKYQTRKILGSGCLVRSDLLRMAGNRVYTGDFKKLTNTDVDRNFWPTVPMYEYLRDTGHVYTTDVTAFRLWQPESRKSLDLQRDLEFAKLGHVCNVIDTPSPTIVAVKGEKSIWRWDHLVGAGWTTEADHASVLELLSEEEREYYNQFIRK